MTPGVVMRWPRTSQALIPCQAPQRKHGVKSKKSYEWGEMEPGTTHTGRSVTQTHTQELEKIYQNANGSPLWVAEMEVI